MPDPCSNCGHELPNDTGTYCPLCGEPRRTGRVHVMQRVHVQVDNEGRPAHDAGGPIDPPNRKDGQA